MATIGVGIIGCGLVTQVEHLPNLMNMPHLFHVIGVADPSQRVREHLAGRWGLEAFETADALFDRKPDAVIIAAPDPYHTELALAALDRRVHVFLEKPVCYDPADAERLITARDRAGLIVQIGYMKRFDPAFRFLCNQIKEIGPALRMISVEVSDPDFWPYVAHRDYIAGDDVPTALIVESALRRDEQVARALGWSRDRIGVRGFAGPYCSALVHDVNLVHGLLEVMGGSVRGVVGAVLFAGGDGGHASATLTPADAVLSMSWVATPRLANYTERIALFFDDRSFELRFPSPYLNHQPTDLIEHRSTLHHHRAVKHRVSYDEAFLEELKNWHRAVSVGTLTENTIEQALRDMRLISELGRVALADK